MNKKGFAPLILLIVAAGILIVGGIGYVYYGSHKTTDMGHTTTNNDTQTSQTSHDTSTKNLVTQCSNPPLEKAPTGVVNPDNVLKDLAAARAFLIKRLGQNIFDCDLTYDADTTGSLNYSSDLETSRNYQTNPYQVEYVYKVPKIDATTEIRVTVNGVTQEASMPLTDIYSAPDCGQNPKKCDIQISSQQAVAIAQKNGMKIVNYNYNNAGFRYDPEYGSFVWYLGATCNDMSFVIDASNGKILSKTSKICPVP